VNHDKSIAHIALYAALIAALGLLPKFNIPFAGVPITGQSLGIMLAGVMLGPVRGALAVCLFLFAVALGLPLLAGGRGGLGVFATPSVGFLLGWPLCAFVAGWIMQRMKHQSVFLSACVAAFVGGIVVMYLCGIPGIALMTEHNLWKSTLAVAVFVPGDVVKVVLTGLIAQTVARGLPQALLSRA